LKGNNLINDGDDVLTLQFIAKKPQDQWGTAAIWTGPKFVGGNDARDMNVTPAMGIVEVKKIKQPIKLSDLEKFIVFPNPNDGMVAIEFTIKEESNTELIVSDLVGRKVLDVLNAKMPQGKYNYIVNLTHLDNGLYLMSLKTDYNIQTSKIIINK
jgi:hypothetical protein